MLCLIFDEMLFLGEEQISNSLAEAIKIYMFALTEGYFYKINHGQRAVFPL
jgi:hypothetical protein